MSQTNISFMSEGLRLSGVLHLPEAEKPPVIIGSHGLLSTKSSEKQKQLARKANENGIAYFRLDHTGCGESEGEFVQTTLETRVSDIVSAAEMLLKREDTGNAFALFGSSMGGAACIAAWERLVKNNFEMKGIVTVAAPVRGKTITEAALKSEEDLSGIPEWFYKKNLTFDLADSLENLKGILIFHGDHDEIIPVSNAHEIFNSARDPKKLIILKGGDHRISDVKHQESFIIDASQWFKELFTNT